MAALGAAELTKKWLSADRLGPHRRAGDLDRRRQHRPRPGDDLDRAGAQGRRDASTPRCAARSPRRRGPQPIVGPEKIKMDSYEAKPRAQRQVLPPAERLARPMDEIDLGITADDCARRGHALLLVRQVLRLREVLDVLPGRLLREGGRPAARPLLQGQARDVRRLQEVRGRVPVRLPGDVVGAGGGWRWPRWACRGSWSPGFAGDIRQDAGLPRPRAGPAARGACASPPFKKGPDFIDAAWLAAASGQPGRNLDTFMMPPAAVLASVARAAGGRGRRGRRGQPRPVRRRRRHGAPTRPPSSPSCSAPRWCWSSTPPR